MNPVLRPTIPATSDSRLGGSDGAVVGYWTDRPSYDPDRKVVPKTLPTSAAGPLTSTESRWGSVKLTRSPSETK